jgi:hypothetical protein
MAASRENLEQKLPLDKPRANKSEILSYKSSESPLRYLQTDVLKENGKRDVRLYRELGEILQRNEQIRKELFGAAGGKDGLCPYSHLKSMLEEHNLHVNVDDTYKSLNLLGIALLDGNLSVVDFLLKQEGIDTSRLFDRKTLLRCALSGQRNKNVRFKMIESLIEAGVDVNEIQDNACFFASDAREDGTGLKSTVLLATWCEARYLEAAKLISLGASIKLSEAVFFENKLNKHYKDDEIQNISEQIASSRLDLRESLQPIVRDLLIHFHTDITLKIVEYLCGIHPTDVRDACHAASESDQIPKPFSFMQTHHDEIYNQKWGSENTGQNQLSSCVKERASPGVMGTL